MAVSRVWALATPWAAAAATSVPKTAIVNNFRGTTRKRLTGFIIHLSWPFSGERCRGLQEGDHARESPGTPSVLMECGDRLVVAREETATACEDVFTMDCDRAEIHFADR
jgi:hypothetical protein